MAVTTPWTPTTGLNTYPTIAAIPALSGTQAANAVNANAAVAAPATANAATAGAATANAATAGAASRGIDNNELMSAQVGKVIADDSTLMQQAAARALQAANGRGLLNSSMAVGAAHGAVMDRAMPIGQYDASAHTNVLDKNLVNQQQTGIFNASQVQDVNKFNAANQQQNSQFNAGQTQDASKFNAANTQQSAIFNAGQEQDVAKFNAANQQQSSQFNTSEANKTAIFNASESNKILAQMMDSQSKMQLADIEASYKTLMQSEASAMQTYQQSVKNISEILMNPDLTATAKTQAVANQNQLLKAGMQIIGKMSGLNLDNLLTFPAYSA